MPDNDDSLPRLLGGRYRLEAKLGHGGMGVVYRAIDLMMHRSVAVKLIRGSDGVELDEEVAGRFLREAKNTARVQHEHIIEVYDLGRSEDGDLYFVMELLEGESLSARLRRVLRLSATETVYIGRQICLALEVAHAAGVIHRDLKPANVMLVRRAGQDDFVKVLDFGVAKSYSPDQQTQLTHTGMLVGTVEYMAPEQIMGRSVDGRTDIYSLGVVLYKMLAGKAPFKDGGVPALIHAHLNVAPKSIVETAHDVPIALERVVMRALAKKPEDRYPTMTDLANALADATETTDLNDLRSLQNLDPDLKTVKTDLGLLNLEYRGGEDSDEVAAPDPYEMGDKTEVGRVSRPNIPGVPPGILEDDITVKGSAFEGTFDEATVRIDRPLGFDPRTTRRTQPQPQPIANVPLSSLDETALLRSDESTAKRSIPDEIARRERADARPCAMCQTLNPPHARACNACGVSLAAEDQAAVRARVQAPRTAHLSAPQMPPPVSGAYAAGPYAHSPAQGIPNVSGWSQAHAQPMSGHMPPRPRPQRPPSAWQRFLVWSGLASPPRR